MAEPAAEKSRKQIPRGLKSARKDKNTRLGRGAKAPLYPNKFYAGRNMRNMAANLSRGRASALTSGRTLAAFSAARTALSS